jgi:hypothetical protein
MNTTERESLEMSMKKTSGMCLRSRGILAVAVAVSLALLLWSASVQGQAVGATLTGTTADAKGAVIANARISIKNISTDVVLELNTNSAGFYTAPNLLPGEYQISVSAPGFQTELHSGITLTVGEQQVLNFSLQVGQVTQTVNVTTSVPTVELSSSAIGGEIPDTAVRELPLNGRDWTMLATLQPGVASMGGEQDSISGGSGSARGNRGFGTELTISGARPQQNNYLVDGISVNDYDNSSPGDALGYALGVDAVQEFSVLTSNYTAEYGRTSGGVVNAITRSGSNAYHGDVYEFLRNSALDARNYFDAATIPPFRRNQFGAAGGGPIRKDHTFFFADYEGLRQNLGVTNVTTVPSQDARNGIIHNANGTTTNVTVDPRVAPALALWNLPNAGTIAPGNTGYYDFAAQQIGADNYLVGRIDQQFSAADRMFGTYQWESSLASLPDSLNDVLIGQKEAHQSAAIEETHAFSSSIINSARIGFSRYADEGGYGISAINPVAGETSLGAIPGEDASQTFVTSLTTLQGGVNDENHTTVDWNSFQIYDDAFVTKGRNSIKFGVSLERDLDHMLQYSTVGGAWHFGSLTSFLENEPSLLTATLPATVGPRYFSQNIAGVYVQDDLRWRPNLTINLALRYEISGLPSEKNNKFVDMRTPLDTAPHLGSPLFYNPTFVNFEPRLGFVWDPFGDGKTSIRAGGGLFDVEPLLYEYGLTELQLYPYATSGRVSPTPAGSYPAGATAALAAAKSQRVAYLQPNMKRDYVTQYNLSVQRQILPNTTIEVGYVGSRGTHTLFRGDDMNMVMPTSTAAGWQWPTPGTGTVLNPNFGRIDISTWNGNSFYNALEVKVTKALGHGLQAQASYTKAKSMDYGSGSNLGDPFENSISNLFWFDNSLKRGLSDYNIAQNLMLYFTWELPDPKFSVKPAEWASRGWELGSILQARTGLPMTPLIGGDPLGTTDATPEDFPNRNYTGSCKRAINPGNVHDYINLSCFSVPANLQLLGTSRRNTIIGPGLVDWDFSAFKNNPIPAISDRFNVQFRAEIFNITNRSDFNSPTDNEDIFDQNGNPVGAAGAIDSTSMTSREVQFALKIIF